MAAVARTALTDEQMELIARALAEPRRVQILRQLGETCAATPCSQLFERQQISPATMSHHVKELESAGLIHSERDGKFVKLKLERTVLEAYLSQLAAWMK